MTWFTYVKHVNNNTVSHENLERRKQTKTTADVSGDKCAGAPTNINITKKEVPAADKLFVLGFSVCLKQMLAK